MKPKLILMLIVNSVCSLLFAANIYFGPGQIYTDYESAFKAAQTGDQIIDCNEIDVFVLESLTKDQSSDTSKAIDRDVDCQLRPP